MRKSDIYRFHDSARKDRKFMAAALLLAALLLAALLLAALLLAALLSSLGLDVFNPAVK